jgi:hypothetical protein
MSVVESVDVEDYVSGRYLSFPGGNEIDGCIPTYEELGNYKSIYFGYFDGRKKTNFFHKFFVSFGVRVYYSDEEYAEKKGQADALRSYNDDTWVTEGYKFIGEGNLNHVLYGALYNDRLHRIEYIAICGDDGDLLKEGWLFSGIIQWNNPPGF